MTRVFAINTSRCVLAVAGAAFMALAACEPYAASPRHYTAPMYLHNIAPDRLMGTWYEIAHFPPPGYVECSHSQVTAAHATVGYHLRNQCQQAGRVVQLSALAQHAGKGRLQARFDGMALPVELRILGMSKDGRTLLIGTSDRMSGWLLHRDPKMTEAERRWAGAEFRKNGYDEAALQRVSQR